MWRNLEALCIADGECKMVHLLWKMINVELSHDSAIPLLGVYPKDSKAGTWRDICTPMFITVWFPIHIRLVHKRWKHLKCPPMDAWINHMWYIHTMAYCAAWWRKEILTHAPMWMNIEDVMLSEIRQSRNVWSHSSELPKVVKFRDKVEWWLPGPKRRGKGNEYLMGMEFQFWKRFCRWMVAVVAWHCECD